MKLNFKTDGSRSRRGFKVKVRSVCGGYLTQDEGVITSPNFPHDYDSNLDCKWTIKTRPGRTFTFWFDTLNITSPNTDTCDGDFITLRNGQEDTSPLILIHPGQSRDQQNGRLCGTQLPARFNTTSNIMNIAFHSNSNGNGKGFRMYFKQTEFGCGGHIRLSAMDPEVIINSPNFPNMPPPHAECIWFVIAPTEHRVQVDFVERFDIRPTGG